MEKEYTALVLPGSAALKCDWKAAVRAKQRRPDVGTSSRDVGSSLAPSCALSALSAFCEALSIAACVGTPAGFAQITKSAWRAPHTVRISSGIAATAFGRRWTRR